MQPRNLRPPNAYNQPIPGQRAPGNRGHAMDPSLLATSQRGRLARLLRELYVSTGLIVFILLVGVLGFVLIEGYSLGDAFYMTIITVSTVGFGEIKTLSAGGRLFTSGLIIFNIGIFTYAITSITRFTLGGNIRMAWHDYTMSKKIDTLAQHIIVCGFGRTGHQVVKELVMEDQNFLLIEQDEELVESFSAQHPDKPILMGDATDEEMLQRAGIARARGIITTLPKDSDNMFVALTARELNPALTIVSRASQDSAISKLYRAGCDHVVLPERTGGTQMAAIITKPDIVEFISLLTSPEGQGLNYASYPVFTLKEEWHHKSVDYLDVRSRTGANLVGIRKASGKFLVNPELEEIPSTDCYLILLGREGQLTRFEEVMAHPERLKEYRKQLAKS